MFLGDIVDQLHDQQRLTHAGAAEQTDFTSFGIGFQQVDHLDSRIEDLLRGGQFIEFRGIAVDWVGACVIELLHAVDRFAHDVHQSALDLLADRHGDRAEV